MRSQQLVFITLLVTSLTFFNVLFNGFVGDDEVVIVRNDFYKSLNNIGHLFDNEYIAHSEDYFVNQKAYFSSGEISYRPVVSLSFFWDYLIWRLNP